MPRLLASIMAALGPKLLALHGLPMSVISDLIGQFLVRSWKLPCFLESIENLMSLESQVSSFPKLATQIRVIESSSHQHKSRLGDRKPPRVHLWIAVLSESTSAASICSSLLRIWSLYHLKFLPIWNRNNSGCISCSCGNMSIRNRDHKSSLCREIRSWIFSSSEQRSFWFPNRWLIYQQLHSIHKDSDLTWAVDLLLVASLEIAFPPLL